MIVPFRTILVSIDESEVSNTAFTAAARLAKALSAKLMIVHVLNAHDINSPQQPYPTTTPGALPGALVIDESIRQQYEREWARYVEHYESFLEQKTDDAIAQGLEADYVHPRGLVGSTICEVARTSDVSLIVVGSHQRRGMAEIMLGSTSNYVMHHAPCSVLVVHPDTKNEDTLAFTTHAAAGKGVAVA